MSDILKHAFEKAVEGWRRGYNYEIVSTENWHFSKIFYNGLAPLQLLTKFEKEADVRKLGNLYTIKLFFLIKELAKISREMIFEGGV